jgi:hypothetical protein
MCGVAGMQSDGRCEMPMQRFDTADLKVVEQARQRAEELIGDFYMLAPREWERMHYEVCTLEDLAPEEICDRAFAQVLCYDCVKYSGATILNHHDLYRICLQDHRILQAAGCGISGSTKLPLEPMLLYVITHELVHVVRFSQRLQRVDLAQELRPQEELSVEETTRRVLQPVSGRLLRKVIEACTDQTMLNWH